MLELPESSQSAAKTSRFRIVRFTKELLVFYFADFHASLKSAWKVALEISGALSLLIPPAIYLLKLATSTEAILLSLVWQIPVCFSLIFLGLILLRGPFLRYQKLQTELEKAQTPNETEEALRGELMFLKIRL